MNLSQSYLVRFWAKVDKNGPIHPVLKTRCWVWTGTTDGKGYGFFRTSIGMRRAHRVSWFIVHKKWPEPNGLHKCDNPPCCNPDHLFEGTHEDNVRDRDVKGRVQRGERNHGTKFTNEDVLEIRKQHATGNTTYKKLAKFYSVNISSIAHIVRRQSWKHI